MVVETRNGVEYVTNLSGLDTTRFPVEFVLEKTFGAEEEPLEHTIASVGEMDVDSRGNVYVMDRGNSRLMAFAADGSHLWNAGQEGEGPGEIQYPGVPAVRGDSAIFLDNQMGTRVDIWSTDGHYMGNEQIPPESMLGGSFSGFVEEHIMVFTSGVRGGVGTKLLFIDKFSYELKDSVVFVQELDFGMPGMTSVASPFSVMDGKVLIGSSTSEYGIWMYDSLGNLNRQVVLNVDYLNDPGVYNNGLVAIGGMSSVLSLPSGIMLVAVSWLDIQDSGEYARQVFTDNRPDPPPTRFQSWDTFDENGRYLGSQVWRNASSPMGSLKKVDADGFLYTSVNRPFPEIRKYRVVRND